MLNKSFTKIINITSRIPTLYWGRSVKSYKRIKLLGEIQEIGFDGKYIVRARFAPPHGAYVFDNRKRMVGRIKRVFGPVASPFVSIEPNDEYRLPNTIGRPLYVEEVDENGKTKRRNG